MVKQELMDDANASVKSTCTVVVDYSLIQVNPVSQCWNVYLQIRALPVDIVAYGLATIILCFRFHNIFITSLSFQNR